MMVARSDLVLVDGQNCAIIQQVYVGAAGRDTVSVQDALSATLVNTVRLSGLGHWQDLASHGVRDYLLVTSLSHPNVGLSRPWTVLRGRYCLAWSVAERVRCFGCMALPLTRCELGVRGNH